MKKHFITMTWVIVICLLARIGLAVGPTFFTSNIGDQRYKQTLTKEELKSSPEWNPETEPCPLKTTKAIALARKKLTDTFPGLVSKPVLISIYYNPDPQRWYYAINLAMRSKEENEYKGMTVVVVTLSGYVPDIEPYNPKAIKLETGTLYVPTSEQNL